MKKSLFKSGLVVLGGILVAGFLVYINPKDSLDLSKVPEAQAQALEECPTAPTNRIEVSIVSDVSASMGDEDICAPTQSTCTTHIRRDDAVRIALLGCGSEGIPVCPSGVNPRTGFLDEFNLAPDGDRVALHTFNNLGYEILSFSTNLGELRAKIIGRDFTAGGSTTMSEGLDSAETEISENGRTDDGPSSPTARVVIVLGDGRVDEDSADVADQIENLPNHQNPRTVVWGIAFGSGIDLADLQAVTTDPNKAIAATDLTGLSGVYSEIAETLVAPSELDFDDDGLYPIYCQGTAVCAEGPCTDYYNKPSDWPQWDVSDNTNDTLLTLFRNAQVSSGDLDQDNHGVAASILPQSYLSKGVQKAGDDADDQNQYVYLGVQEGLCAEDLNRNGRLDVGEDLDSDNEIDPITCAGPLTSTAWTLQGGKQYANCTDYYADTDLSASPPSGLTCATKYGISPNINPFYTCTDSDSKPAYLPADVVRSANAVAIDNNQIPGGNEREISCPKAGGLVPCGRYSDDPVTADIDESQPCGFCHFFLLFKTVIDFIMLKIIPAVAGLIVVFGGFMLVISRGNPQQSKLGKDAIIYTFIGYAVVLVGWLVLNSALAGIGVQKWTGLVGESGNMNFTQSCVITSCTKYQDTDKTWATDEWKGLLVTMNHNEWSGPKTATIASNDSDTLTLQTPIDNESQTIGGISYTIGGWWQFSCGQ